MVDHYETLGVSRDVSADEIRKARHDLVLKYHPDLHHSNPQAKETAEEIMKAVNSAYDVLSDCNKRAEYDYNLREWEHQRERERQERERAQRERERQERERAQRERERQERERAQRERERQERERAQRERERQERERAQQERERQERERAQQERERQERERAQSSTRSATAATRQSGRMRPALSWSAVIQSAILLAIASLAAGIALLIPHSQAWLSDTLGYGWVSVGAFVVITPLPLSLLRTDALWGWRLWLATAVVAAISIIAMALIDGGSDYGISGLWGRALTGGGKPFIIALELFLAVEVLIPLLVTDANTAKGMMAVVAVLALVALVAWVVYIIVIWIIANIAAILGTAFVIAVVIFIAIAMSKK